MRRAFIYPHRSVRAFPLSRQRLLTAIVMASILRAAVFYLGKPLLTAHNRVSFFLLDLTRISSSGIRMVDVFPYLGAVAAPDVPVPHHRTHPLRTSVSFAVCVFALIVIHRRI